MALRVFYRVLRNLEIVRFRAYIQDC